MIPRVSVVMPVYNAGRDFMQAIRSVAGQTFAEHELIIVDDGSTDPLTKKLVADAASRPNVTLHRTENRGPAAARNLGIEHARAPYILPLDADDWLAPAYLAKTVPVLDTANDVGVVHTWVGLVGAHHGTWKTGPFELPALLSRCTLHVTSLYRRELWKQVGGYDGRFRESAEDWDLWLGAAGRGWQGRCVPEVLCYYRRSPQSRERLARAPGVWRRLVGDLVTKHRALYDAHLPEAMAGLYEEYATVCGALERVYDNPAIRAAVSLRALLGRGVMPAVSVVLATRNQARWLGETLASVRAQTFADWELLVADDGSTDDTAAVVAAVDDPRVHWLPAPHAERAAARNRALAAAKGRYVAFLDGDDCWHPDKLGRQVAQLDAAPDAALSYTIARFVDAAGMPLAHRKPDDPPSGCIFPRLVRGNVIILASVVARRDHVAAAGGFDETLPVYGCEDWGLWLRLARRAPVVAIADELTRYRRHAGNTAWADVLRSGLAVLDRLYADPTVAAEAGLSRAAARARHLWYHATIAAADERGAGFALAAAALRESPATALSRPALGTLAALVLPRPALRTLGRLPA